MLRELHIENYALIDRLDLSFSDGFSVITGETGAGKSILLGALSLILGQRAENKVIKENAEKCLVEATFDIRSYGLEALFLKNDLEYDSEACVVRRELYSNGKSRAFVNDSPVSLNILKELTGQLIDIHSQHQNLLLGNDVFQREVIDAVAGNSTLTNTYKSTFLKYKECQSALHKLEETSRKAKEEEDYLRFQFDQLHAADLQENEQEVLETELEMLVHAEEIKAGISKIFNLLDDEEHGVVAALKASLNQSESLLKIYSGLQEPNDRIRSCYLDLKDLSRDLSILLNDVEINPSRMDQVNERLNLLYTLQQKHRMKSTVELIAFRDELAAKLAVIDSCEDDIARLRKEMTEAFAQSQSLASQLTETRKNVCPILEKRLISQLVLLGMPKAVFRVERVQKELDIDGQDTVTFLFSANKNSSPQPIHQIASGGEMSRIMLCIKALIADFTNLPTLLLDEIDTGVSGEIAHRMGEIMCNIAQKRQVICITHLPQIASKGSRHYKVSKTEEKNSSITIVKSLSEEERLMEIAWMLSGANLTEAALQNARELLFNNHS
jgi:DNA repair protein RecN (Recombination protein N)